MILSSRELSVQDVSFPKLSQVLQIKGVLFDTINQSGSLLARANLYEIILKMQTLIGLKNHIGAWLIYH